MQVVVEHAIKVLANTPATVRAMLRELDQPWIVNNYGPETFSPFDVIGHLLHGEQNDWIPRIRIILQHGSSRPFDPFDRYAMYEQSKGKSLVRLLDEFEQARRNNLQALRQMKLSERQLALPGAHPALGTVTLGQLIATWVCHDLNHIHQIAKSMAWQYKDEMGPWRDYVTFIDR